jgi:hypothetical protein
MNLGKISLTFLSILLSSLFYQTFLLSQNFIKQIKTEREISKLAREIENLRISVAQQNSLLKLEEFIKEKNLIKSNQIKFVEVLERKSASK